MPAPFSLDRVAGAFELRQDGVAARPDGVAGHCLQLRPDRVAGPPAAGHARSAVLEPLAPARAKVQFTASAALRDKLERLRALMRSSVPDGDLAEVDYGRNVTSRHRRSRERPLEPTPPPSP